MIGFGTTTFFIGKLEFLRKLKITFIVRGYGHDRAGAVGTQNIIRDPDRNLFLRRRIDRHHALSAPRRSYPSRPPGACDRSCATSSSTYFFTSSLFYKTSSVIARERHPRMFWREHEICRAEQRVRARGETYLDRRSVRTVVIRIFLNRAGISTTAPSLFPIQSSCRLIVADGQSRPFRSASKRSA